MKKIFFGCLLSMITFLAVYLIGCFMNASFNLHEWDAKDRGFIGFIGGFMSLAVGFVVASVSYLDGDKK